MPFIISHFGSYNAFDAWCDGKIFTKYIVKLTNVRNNTYEILHQNPIDITDMGFKLERHELYEGIFSFTTLKIKFINRPTYGGDLLKAEYDTYGVKGKYNCDVYKKNTQNNDYDIYFSGKIDFSDNSYEYDITNQIVSVMIIQQGKVMKLLSRDELNINLRSAKSIEGNNITPFVNENRTIVFNKIDIPLIVDLIGNNNGTESGFVSDVNTIGLIASDIYTNQMGSRLVVNTSTRESVLYNNDSGQNRIVTIELEGTHSTQLSISGSGTNSTDILIEGLLFRGSDVYTMFTHHILRTNISGTENINLSDAIDINFNELIFDGESIEMFVRFTINTTNISWGYNTTTGITKLFMIEYSSGAPNSSVRVMPVHEALTRFDQIINDETIDSRLIYSTVYGRTNSEKRTYSVNGEGGWDVLTDGWQLRRIPDKSFMLNFRNLFKTLKHTRGVGMGFDTKNQRFYIEYLSEFYKNTLILDLGIVDSIIEFPDKHPNNIKCGYNFDGNYDDFSGAYELNLKMEFSTSFEAKNPIDLTIPIRSDSLGQEICRRKSRFLSVSEDSDADSAVFINVTDGVKVLQGDSYGATGFPGCEQRYNYNITPRACIQRISRIIKQFTLKTNETPKFLNNTKDLNANYNYPISGGRLTEKTDLSLGYTENPFVFPEIYKINTKITDSQLNLIMANPHGYITCRDKFMNIYYFYIKSLDVKTNNMDVEITGLKQYR